MSGDRSTSPWRWTLLALLHERSMHPYEMQRLATERGKDMLVEHKPGSLYSAIDQLRRAGLIEEEATSREGRLPERTTYRITDAGRQAFLSWLDTELGQAAERDFPRFAFALEKITHLAPSAAAELLRTRVGQLAQQVGRLDDVLRQAGALPRVALLEIEYARALRTAELDWTRSVLDDIDHGRLDWDLATLSHESSHDDTRT